MESVKRLSIRLSLLVSSDVSCWDGSSHKSGRQSALADQLYLTSLRLYGDVSGHDQRLPLEYGKSTRDRAGDCCRYGALITIQEGFTNLVSFITSS